MVRISYLLLITIAALGQGDPAFENIMFDKSLKGDRERRFDWSLRVDPPVLTELQRLRISVVATVDGGNVAKWQDPGQMASFLEVRDHQNRSYRTQLPLTLPERSLSFSPSLRDLDATWLFRLVAVEFR